MQLPDTGGSALARGGAEPLNQPRVVVVDDDAAIRLMIREVLEPAGFAIAEAADGRSGLELFSAERPDIVLLDIVMPGMDGFATLEQMRALSHHPGCAVVMLTGLNDEKSIERAYDLGATDFITKPINWTLLLYRLRYLLRWHTSEGRAHD